MNWKSIELLQTEDLDKPILLKYEGDAGVTEYSVARVNEEGDVYAEAGDNYRSYICNTSDVYPPRMWFVRIAEIL